MKRLLIRADDLGFSEAVNYGIEKTVKQGIIKTVGLMVNMDATIHGFNLIKDANVCLGLHTNICVGRPISNPKDIPSIIQANGEFRTSSEYRKAEKDFVNLDEVVMEIEAQYKRFVEITGHNPHYFEGHAVASENFFKGLEIVAQKYNLPLLLFSFDGQPILFRETKLYIHMDSMNTGYNPEKSLKSISFHQDSVEMFVCHPGYLDEYILNHSSLTIPRTQEVEMLCNPGIEEWIQNSDIELVTYDDL